MRVYNKSVFLILLKDAFNGYVSGAGLVKKKGFKGSFVEARSNAKVNQRSLLLIFHVAIFFVY